MMHPIAFYHGAKNLKLLMGGLRENSQKTQITSPDYDLTKIPAVSLYFIDPKLNAKFQIKWMSSL